MSSPQKAHEAIDAALTGNGSLAAAHAAVDEALEEVMAAGAGKGFQDAVIAARHSLFCEKHPAPKQLPAVPVDCQVCKHVAALEAAAHLCGADVAAFVSDWTSLRLLLIANDTFGYACADGEEVTLEEAPMLLSLYRKEDWPGLVKFMAKRRKCEPLKEVQKEMRLIDKLREKCAVLEGELADVKQMYRQSQGDLQSVIQQERRSVGGGHAQNCRCHPHDGLTFICQGAKQNDSPNHPHPYTDPRCKPAPGENPEDGTSEHDHKPAPIPTRNEIINRWSLLWDFNLTTMENWKACADAVLKLMGER